MRYRHVLSETWNGISRNLTMIIAVIMTMWVSLTLFGGGLLAYQQVELLKGRWYDEIEVSVFLCTKTSAAVPNATVGTPGAQCTSGEVTTEAQKQLIRTTLESNPLVARVYFESRNEAFEEFQKTYRNSPAGNSLTVDQMPESFRVKLKDPNQYRTIASSVAGLPGVDNVLDLREYLDPFFRILRIIQNVTIGAAILLLLSAALQIGNTIRLTAFARRREIGIMRLVGASNLYITLPFLLEAIFAALVGALLACVTLFTGVYLVSSSNRTGTAGPGENTQVSSDTISWIGLPEAATAAGWVALVGIVLAIIPTLITTRKYLRV